MTSDAKLACADMTFADAIQDYAAAHDVSEASVRDMLIASGAYDALYDEETGLWAEGPDALIAFHQALMAEGAGESCSYRRKMGEVVTASTACDLCM